MWLRAACPGTGTGALFDGASIDSMLTGLSSDAKGLRRSVLKPHIIAIGPTHLNFAGSIFHVRLRDTVLGKAREECEIFASWCGGVRPHLGLFAKQIILQQLFRPSLTTSDVHIPSFRWMARVFLARRWRLHSLQAFSRFLASL